MIASVDKQCSIFLGDAASFPIQHKAPEFVGFCDELRQRLGLDYLVFQHQVHGISGWIIDSDDQLSPSVMCFMRDGDYIITNQPRVGIGVLTADCLPIVFYAPRQRIVAVAHAGWRGSVAGIGPIVVRQLQERFSICPSDIKVFFGPSAKRCCYSVSDDFLNNLNCFDFKDKLVIQKNNGLFFDNPLLNRLLLESVGVLASNISDVYNVCTICNPAYHSYRRTVDKEHYKTQATIVWLC